MIRKSSVDELITESKEIIRFIDNLYGNAESVEDIVGVAKPKVKSCLEHLRSSLEYIAQDLSEFTNSSKTPKNVYFPYGKDRKIFVGSANKNLPDLSDKFRNIIESIQPHSCGNNWLLHLCKVTNVHKHDQLQEQIRVNSPNSKTSLDNTISVKDNAKIFLFGSTVNGKKVPDGFVLETNKSTKELQEGHDIPIERKYDWVKFIIKGTQIDILTLLKKSHDEISKLSRVIYEE